MTLREAAQQALEALEHHGGHLPWNSFVEVRKDLRAALAEEQDWDEIEALRASLREHMAEIHRLRAAGRKALDALMVWQHSLTDPSAIPGWRFSVVGERAITALRAVLADPMLHEFAGVKIKEIRIPENMYMRFDGDVLVIERAHGIGGEE